jgi:hypothetical protein
LELCTAETEYSSSPTTWPTPTTRDHKDGTAASCKNVPPNGLLGRVVHQWPTPSVKGNYNRKGLSEKSGDGLATAVKQWASPHANCSTGAGSGPNKTGGENLQTQVGGSLNPTWVEWLMGFPPEWTVCEPLVTPSSRSKPIRSSGRSRKSSLPE